MHPDDLMKSDAFSEVLLLSAVCALVLVLLVVAAMALHAPPP